MKLRRSIVVYGLLGLIWTGIVVWQIAEHSRVRNEIHKALINRAKDIANSMGVWTRSATRDIGVSQTRVEAALQELLNASWFRSVAVLNANNHVIASAGPEIDLSFMKSTQLPAGGDPIEFHNSGLYTIVTPVNLGLIGEYGTSTTQSGPTVLINDRTTSDGQRGGRQGGPPPGRGDRMTSGSQRGNQRGGGSGRDGARPDFAGLPPPDRGAGSEFRGRPGDSQTSQELAERDAFRRGGPGGRGGRGGGSGGGPGPGFGGRGGAFWRQIRQERGAYSIALLMSAEEVNADISSDFWMRFALLAFALVTVVGIGYSWRTMVRSQVMEARLIRASEVNAHLQELNLAAAGLAHETRNPLNIVRGQAQMISKVEGMPPDVSGRSRAIVEEVDRVTSRLNQFLDYSKPRQVKRAPTDVAAVTRDLSRTMQSDLEDKLISFEVVGPEPMIEADETLLRQVLFNLILNAVQAVDRGGLVQVRFERNLEGWTIEVADNGHGVPYEARDQIFRPYFTTNAHGTGLGLAVVRQIVLAHQWEIDYIPGDPIGSRFRIRGIKGAQKAQR